MGLYGSQNSNYPYQKDCEHCRIKPKGRGMLSWYEHRKVRRGVRYNLLYTLAASQCNRGDGVRCASAGPL